MLAVPDWVVSYGLLGVLIWMAFELRDLRRWFRLHLELFHVVPDTKKNG